MLSPEYQSMTEARPALPVKREVVSVSVGSLPEFTFPSSCDIMAACKKCQKERNKGNRYRQKGKRKQINRANTPIVIQLKDTLKAALRQKQRSLTEAVGKARSRDDDSTMDRYGGKLDVFSKKDMKICSTPPTYQTQDMSKKKDVKNFSALISIIERAHQKEAPDIETNLVKEPVVANDKLVAEYVLNNASCSSKDNRRSIVECENVDVICNDLTNNSEKSSDSPEDTESDLASVTSSSELQSDSDLSNGTQEGSAFEFTNEELEKLAEFTTGCPLIRYDCSPTDCPQCCLQSSWPYSHSQYYQYHHYDTHHSSQYFSKKSTKQTHARHRVDSFHEEAVLYESDTETENTVATLPEVMGAQVSVVRENVGTKHCQSEPRSRRRGVASAKTPNTGSRSRRTAPQKQLLDIDIGRKANKSSGQFTDSVYIDLTDTDVTFTVYYHHDYVSQSSPYSCTTYSPSRSHYCVPHSTTMPLPMGHLGTMPYVPWPTYYPPINPIPAPLYLPIDPSMPKTMMVPPEELDHFNATQPPQRQWIIHANPERNRPTAIFTVMCYNVLCDKYCTRQQYGYCPSWALNWEYRKKGIIEEIKNCAADIISLQEVETDQYDNFFLPELKREGYEGIFSPKSRARTMTDQDRKHVDGCAIFYRTTKFSLIKNNLIEFNQLAMANAEGSDDMLNRVMTKDNIGLAAMLETREGVYENGLPAEGQIRQPVLVATAHVHWDPEFSDVKLIQTMMLMWELKNIIDESVRTFRPGTSQPDASTIPMILCGDLNSLPDSGVIEYLMNGKVAATHGDFKDHGYEAALQKISCASDKEMLTHTFRLARAYDNDIMPYTNYTYDFKGIIDYIFYTREHMNLLGVLGPLDQDWFSENKVVGCPHPHIPSDHFSLFVELEMPVRFQNGRGPSAAPNKLR